MAPKKIIRKRNINDREKELILRGKMQEYGEIMKTLGDARMEVYCYDDKTRLGRVCGRIKRRTRIKIGDIVLVSLRPDLEKDKCDIIEKYNEIEVKTLRKMKELPARLHQEKDPEERKDDGLEIIFDDDYNVEFNDI